MNAKEAKALAESSKLMPDFELILEHITIRAKNGYTDMYWDNYIDSGTVQMLRALGYKASISGMIDWS